MDQLVADRILPVVRPCLLGGDLDRWPLVRNSSTIKPADYFYDLPNGKIFSGADSPSGQDSGISQPLSTTQDSACGEGCGLHARIVTVQQHGLKILTTESGDMFIALHVIEQWKEEERDGNVQYNTDRVKNIKCR